MRKKILAGVMLATMIFSLTACGSNEGNTTSGKNDSVASSNKSDEKAFDEALEAYSTYFKNEINPNDNSDIGVTITLDKYGMPVMIVADSSSDSINSTIYVVEDGNVKAIKDFRKTDDGIFTYMDGIISVEVKSKQYEYYQLAGSELISVDDIISETFQKWNTKAATSIKSFAGNEMNYELLNEELGVVVGSGDFYLGDDFTGYTGGYAQVSADISELYDLIYKEIYSDNVTFSGYNSLLELDYCDNGDVGHVFSSPLLSFGGMYELSVSDFQYYIRELKEKGSMSWEDFFIWHWNLFTTENEDIIQSNRVGLEDVIQRNIDIADKMDIFTNQTDKNNLEEYETAVVLYALYNKKYDLLDTNEFTKNMTPAEVLDALNVSGQLYNYATREGGKTLSEVVGFDNLYGSDGSQTDKAKLLKSYMEKNIIKSNKKETLEAFYEFVQNSKTILNEL